VEQIQQFEEETYTVLQETFLQTPGTFFKAMRRFAPSKRINFSALIFQ